LRRFGCDDFRPVLDLLMMYQTLFPGAARKRAGWGVLALLAMGFCTTASFGALRQPTPDPNIIVGIGAILGTINGGYPDITGVVKNGPADRDGRLKVNDRIEGVAQGNGQFVSCANMPVGEVVNMIRGEKGTTVRLQILPAGVADPKQAKVISLVRAEIKQAEFANLPGGGVGGVIPPVAIIQGGGALIIIPNGARPGGGLQILPIPRLIPAPVAPADSPAPAPAAADAATLDSTPAPAPSPSATPLAEAGIGVTLAGGRDYPVIARILPGGPAQRDGRLKVNDRITGISEGEAPFTDCKEMPLLKAESLLNGAKDSRIRLRIIPAGATDPSARTVVPLTRAVSDDAGE